MSYVISSCVRYYVRSKMQDETHFEYCFYECFRLQTLRGGRMAADACPRIVVQKVKYIPTDVSQKISFQAKNLILDHPSDTIKVRICMSCFKVNACTRCRYVNSRCQSTLHVVTESGLSCFFCLFYERISFNF